MTRALRATACLGFALGCVLAPAKPAAAGDLALAEQLFSQGREAMARHDYAGACAKFQASHDLDTSATGTLLNLATCHEQLHMNARAWAEFRQAAAESRGRREDRVQLATEGEQRLYARLDYVIVRVAPAASVPGLAVALDGQTLPPTSLGARVPVDPGHHVVTATAPGRRASRYELELGAEKDEKQVELAPLPLLSAPAAERQRDAAGAPVLGYAVGGAGLLVLAGGITVGVVALQTRSSALALCGGCIAGSTEAGSARDKMSTARTEATLADVLVPVGAVATAVGAYLVLFRGKSAADSRSARIVPALAGATLEGSF